MFSKGFISDLTNSGERELRSSQNLFFAFSFSSWYIAFDNCCSLTSSGTSSSIACQKISTYFGVLFKSLACWYSICLVKYWIFNKCTKTYQFNRQGWHKLLDLCVWFFPLVPGPGQYHVVQIAIPICCKLHWGILHRLSPNHRVNPVERKAGCMNMFKRWSYPCSSRRRIKLCAALGLFGCNPRTMSWKTLPLSSTDVSLIWEKKNGE